MSVNSISGIYARINKAVKAGTAYKVFVLNTIDERGRWGFTEYPSLAAAKRGAEVYRAAGHTSIDIFADAREV